MVFVEGYDPSTPALKVLCYYQLSYTKSLRPITVGVSPDDIVATNHQTSTLAETVRFERTVGEPPHGNLANCCFRPLSHVSTKDKP